MLLKISLIVSFLVIVSSLTIEPRIINGERTFKGEFPFAVSFRLGYIHHCGGSIISNRHVLTAAHCLLAGTNASAYKLFVGSNKLTEGIELDIESIKQHEKYIGQSDWWRNDLAIIKLKRPLQFNSTIQKIQIRSTPLDENEPVTVIGWGLTLQPSFQNPNTQQKLSAQYISTERCRQWWANISPNQFCHWNGPHSGKGHCSGDSGGPVISGNRLVGVVSWGPVYCARDKPDVAVKLQYFLPWITENML